MRLSVTYLTFLPALLGITLLLLTLSHPDLPRPHPLLWLWCGVILLFAGRSIFSEVGAHALFWWVYYCIVAGLGLSVGMLMTNPNQLRTLSRSLMLASAGVLGVAAYALLAGDTSITYTQNRLTPFGVQANIWGPTSLVAFLNCVLYLQLARRYRDRLLRTALVVLSAMSLFLSFSRGA